VAFTSIELYNNSDYCQAKSQSANANAADDPFWIFTGTNEGQLHVLNKTDLKWNMIQQVINQLLSSY
jgi:hypothetical protein